MDGSEFAYIHRNSFVFIELFILTVIMFSILLRFIIRLPSKVIFLLGTIFYLVLGIYLIMHQNDILRHDALEVYKSAKNLNQFNYSSLKQLVGYLYKYPHQIGLVSLERLLLLLLGAENVKGYL